jgi:DNA polymerase III epsilon subunit-like protein|uniref:DNA 3'-5' helicase n=1 Tax=viral metagenome TaxID=1070528 RepID=A0A6C0BHK5_9ZZZZ
MNFIFDVETTGLPKFEKKRKYPSPENLSAFENARLLSISWIISHNATVVEQAYFIVKPEDFFVNEESTKIHGITHEQACNDGVNIRKVLIRIHEAFQKCKNIIAHNIDFDKSILTSEFYRYDMQEALHCFNSKKLVCTMKKGKQLMGSKAFPKLGALYKYLYGDEIQNAHNAQYDTLYCYKCFVKLFPKNQDVFFFGEREIHLTDEQRRIVYENTEQNILVVACAGSGKSSTTLCRIKQLIESGVDESSIILTTFTRDATHDMKEKLVGILGYKPNMHVGTIDGICKLMTETMGYGHSNTLRHVGEYGHEFLEFLKNSPKSFFSKYKYIFVDEFQDINQVQYEIIKCFFTNGVKLFAVGDDAQNIYSFRGSSVEYIVNFTILFPGSVVHKLTKNFRSSKPIVDFANASMEMNIEKIPKLMQSANTKNNKKPCIEYFSSQYQQNAAIVQLVKHYISNGTKEHHIAILCPMNGLLYSIEDLLTKENIAHVLLDGKGDMKTKAKNEHVVLSTIHKSKGLEWDVVILANMSDDNIPKAKNNKSIEEDRRLFYVAITRARTDLHILYTAKQTCPYVTRYVSEIDQNLVEWVKFNSRYLSGVSSNDKRATDKDIMKMVSFFDGTDFIKLKEANVLPSKDQIICNSVHKPHTYDEDAVRQDLQNDINILVKNIIIRDACIVASIDCVNSYAVMMLASVFLDSNDYNTYLAYNSDNATLSQDQQAKIRVISSRIIDKTIKYQIDGDDVPVLRCDFVPDTFISSLKIAYKVYKNRCIASKDCLDDLWEVSKCQRVLRDKRKRLLFRPTNVNNFTKCLNLIDDASEFFCSFVKNFKSNDIETFCKYKMDNGYFCEFDMRVGNNIILVKPSSMCEVSLDWIMHALISKVLFETNNTEKIIKSAYIYNPIQGVCYHLDLEYWDKHTELLHSLL